MQVQTQKFVRLQMALKNAIQTLEQERWEAFKISFSEVQNLLSDIYDKPVRDRLSDGFAGFDDDVILQSLIHNKKAVDAQIKRWQSEIS